MRITGLVDNSAAADGLSGEHGLSFWMEAHGRRVLFDTGQGPSLPLNVARLNIDIASADAIVLSHGHYDHTGGLAWVLENAPNARIFRHPRALEPKYALRKGAAARSIGIPPASAQALAASSARTTPTPSPLEILPGIWLTGAVPRNNNFEDPGRFFLDPAGEQPDPLEDDQALWAETPTGPVVVLGCAHSGVINTLEYILRLTGESHIRAVLGGMHLGTASVARISRTGEALEALQVEAVAPCHCTGAQAAAQLHDRLGATFLAWGAGAVWETD